MTDAPYNPETGEWQVFSDPRQQQRATSRTATVPMAATREGAWTTTANLTGDVRAAEDLIPNASQQLRIMHQINANDFEQYERFMPIDNDGGYVNCRRSYHEDIVDIHVRPKLKPLGPMLLNFDGNNSDYFSNNCFIDKINGLPVYFNNAAEAPNITTYDVVRPTFTTINGSNCIGIETDSSGVKKYSCGALKIAPKTVKYASTVFLVASIKAGGNMSPSSPYVATDLHVVGKRFLVSAGNYSDGRFYISTDSGYYNISEGLDDAKIIVAQRTVGTGGVLNGYPEVYYQTFLNGEKILESDPTGMNEWMTWGPSGAVFGNDGNDFVVKSMYCGSNNSHAAIHQFIHHNDTISDDELKATTDKLAKKWGL